MTLFRSPSAPPLTWDPVPSGVTVTHDLTVAPP